MLAWQQQRFHEHWRRLSQRGTPGQLAIAHEVRERIQAMRRSNPTWDAPHIVGALRKLGIDVAKSTVEKYCVRPPQQVPSPTMTHVGELQGQTGELQ